MGLKVTDNWLELINDILWGQKKLKKEKQVHLWQTTEQNRSTHWLAVLWTAALSGRGRCEEFPQSQHGKSSQTRSLISLCRGEITSLTNFDGERNPRVQAHTSSLPGRCSVLLHFSHPSLSFPHASSIPPLWPSSCTHLCDLIQQFVVFLLFLQGAQIATHSSCQGNGTGYPMECVRRVLFPRGVECTPPLLQLPCSSFSSVRPQRSSQSAVSAGHTLPQKLRSCVSGRRRRVFLPVTPSPDCSSHAYIHSPRFSPSPPPLSVNTPMLAHTFGSWRRTSSHGSPPSHACSGWIDNVLIGWLREGGWGRWELTGFILGDAASERHCWGSQAEAQACTVAKVLGVSVLKKIETKKFTN